jgi:hypothetical protein
LSSFRSKGLQYVQYLGNILIFGRTPSQTLANLGGIAQRLIYLGYGIYLKKSIIFPSQEMDFLGLTFDSNMQEFRVDLSKLKMIGSD